MKKMFLTGLSFAIMSLLLVGCAIISTKTVVLESSSIFDSNISEGVKYTQLSDSDGEDREIKYLGFSKEDDVMLASYDKEGYKFGVNEDYAGKITRLNNSFEDICYISAADSGGKVAFEAGGGLYIFDADNQTIAGIDGIECQNRITDIRWSEDSRYMSFALKKNGVYEFDIYDTSNGSLKKFSAGEYDISKIEDKLNSLRILGICYTESGSIIAQVEYESNCYMMVVPGEKIKSSDLSFWDFALEKCSSSANAIVNRGNKVYYIDNNNALLCMDMQDKSKQTVANGVDIFAVSRDGSRIMYTIEQSNVEIIYEANANDLHNEHAIVDIQRSVGMLCVNLNGTKALIQYTKSGGENEAFLVKYKIMEIED